MYSVVHYIRTEGIIGQVDSKMTFMWHCRTLTWRQMTPWHRVKASSVMVDW